MDTRKPHRLNDTDLWQEFTKTITADRTAAIGFLEKIANEPQPAQLPMTSDPAGGFSNRLWKLAERHAQPDLPDHCAPTEFRLRLVSDNVPLRLPASTRLILITFEGVAAQTDQIDTEELCTLLNEYNAKLTLEQTHERFLEQPISAAMTYVGERTGQLCPSGFVTNLDQRIIARDRRDLDLMPGLQTLLQRLFDGGVDVGIVSMVAVAGLRPRKICLHSVS